MDDHLGILQQRIEAVTVGGDLSADQAERVGGEVDQQQEEHLHRSDDGRSVRRQLRIDFVAQPQHQRVARQQPGPEQQRAFLS